MHRTEPPKYLLRPEEAAEALGIGRAKTYELITSGQIRSIQIGRSRRIPITAVEEFVRDREAAASPR